MDDLDEMDSSNLVALVKMLERERHGSRAIASKMSSLVRKNTSEQVLIRWVNLVETHFDRIHETYGNPNNDLCLIEDEMIEILERIVSYRQKNLVGDLNAEQEWALIIATADTFYTGLFYKSGRSSAERYLIEDADLLKYIVDNAHRVSEITSVMRASGATVPGQIDAYLEGNHTVLLEGAL